MRIYSLSKVLALPIVGILATMAYYHYVLDVDMGFKLLIPVFFIVVLFVSYPYIDYWYHTKYPIPLDEEITTLLNRYSPFYRGLSEKDREKYDYRMSLYLEAREFKSVGSEHKDMPEDIKAILASNGIQMNFHKDDHLIGDFDRIYAYKHPFPSPTHQFLHSVEAQGEDGMIIYSLEHVIPGITDPQVYYNIGMHGYVEAFTKAYPNADYPWKLDAGWEDVEAISGIKEDFIMKTLGFESVDMFVVLATCYFTYPDAFAKRLPELKLAMDKCFGKE